jgi:hypothetical protein
MEPLVVVDRRQRLAQPPAKAVERDEVAAGGLLAKMSPA